MRSERKAGSAPPVRPYVRRIPRVLEECLLHIPPTVRQIMHRRAGTPGVLAAGRTPVWFSCMLESMMTVLCASWRSARRSVDEPRSHSNDHPGCDLPARFKSHPTRTGTRSRPSSTTCQPSSSARAGSW